MSDRPPSAEDIAALQHLADQQRRRWPQQYGFMDQPPAGQERTYGELARAIESIYEEYSCGPDDEHEWPEDFSELEIQMAINKVMTSDPFMQIILTRWGVITAEAKMRLSNWYTACIAMTLRSDLDVEVASSNSVQGILWERCGLGEPLPEVDD